MTALCPECAGERLPRHPAGLVFRHEMRCGLLAAEDARKVADSESGYHERSITPTERLLLAACGGDPSAIPDITAVEVTSPGVIRRTWAGYDPDNPPQPAVPDPDSLPMTTAQTTGELL